MRYYFTIFFFLICGILFSQEAQKLSWDDLIPTDRSTDFEDPFEKLTREQLQNLSYIARIEALEEHKPEMVQEAARNEKDSLRVLLARQKVNVDSLFKIRFEIADKRRIAAEATVAGLNGTHAKLPGYLLPLDYSGKAVTEFLLVPWVGACIHTPPPPKNQIVYVKLNEGYEVHSRFEAVWITGEITTKDKSTELFLVDGSDDINSGYSMMGSTAEPYKK